MDDQRMMAVMEAILFTMGDSVEIAHLAGALEVETKKVHGN